MHEHEFRDLLARGSGRAILYARQQDITRFRDTTLEACLYCLAVDPQAEGTRASYMLDLLDCVPDRCWYYDAVLDTLADSGDDWHAVQRFHFAACLAKEGEPRARHLLYGNYRPGPRMGALIGVEFVDLDGLDGLRFVAGRLGAVLAEHLAGPELGWLLRHCFDTRGEELTREVLDAEAAANPLAETFRDAAFGELMPRIPLDDARRMVVRPASAIDGDHTVMLARFGEASDREERHQVGLEMLRLLDEPGANGHELAMLRALFAHGPCSFCRGTAVRRLIALGEFDSEMTTECQWDANPDLRKISGGLS